MTPSCILHLPAWFYLLSSLLRQEWQELENVSEASSAAKRGGNRTGADADSSAVPALLQMAANQLEQDASLPEVEIDKQIIRRSRDRSPFAWLSCYMVLSF